MYFQRSPLRRPLHLFIGCNTKQALAAGHPRATHDLPGWRNIPPILGKLPTWQSCSRIPLLWLNHHLAQQNALSKGCCQGIGKPSSYHSATFAFFLTLALHPAGQPSLAEAVQPKQPFL